MAVREYVGARYVPIFVGEWDSTMRTTYEPLSIVSVANVGSYTSKKFVPVGIPITNTEFWALSATTSGQITQLTERVETLEAVTKTPEQFGAKGDGLTDDTAALNSALAGGGVIVFNPDSEYLVNPDTGLLVSDNSYIDLNGATIKATASANAYYEVFHINKKKNVTLKNGKVVGERSSHTGTSGEWGMCVYVGGCENILIDNLDISDAWGDGIYIGDTKTYENIKCKNIRVSNCVINNCRRQGISVTYAEDVVISDNLIKNTNGTAPEAGIDVEPNANLSVKHIIITDNILIDNMFAVAVSGAASGAAVEDVIISDNIMKSVSATRDVIRIHTAKSVIIDSNIISDTVVRDSIVYFASIDGCSFTNNNITHCQSGATAITWAINSGTMTGNRFSQITVSSGEFLYILSGSYNMISNNMFQNITTTANEYVIYMAATAIANVFKNNLLMSNTAQYAIAFGNNANSNHIINNMIYGTYDVTIYCRTNGSSAELVSFNDIQSGTNGATGGAYGFTGVVAANIIDNAYVA